jgi:hypothetical protein
MHYYTVINYQFLLKIKIFQICFPLQLSQFFIVKFSFHRNFLVQDKSKSKFCKVRFTRHYTCQEFTLDLLFTKYILLSMNISYLLILRIYLHLSSVHNQYLNQHRWHDYFSTRIYIPLFLKNLLNMLE